MLSGLLYPSGGEARVLGFVPSKRQRGFLSRITLVMGNRNQLQWDLPALDSYELNRAIYRIPRDQFGPTRDELIELLDIGDLVRKPVRQLSLGERMKAEIVGALLHRPQVLFLDEPTIGLDVTMQKRIRAFVADYNAPLRRDGPPDEPLHGRRRGAVQAASSSSTTGGSCTTASSRGSPISSPPTRRSASRSENGQADLARYGEVIHRTVTGSRCAFRRRRRSSVTARLLTEEQVLDLTSRTRRSRTSSSSCSRRRSPSGGLT